MSFRDCTIEDGFLTTATQSFFQHGRHGEHGEEPENKRNKKRVSFFFRALGDLRGKHVPQFSVPQCAVAKNLSGFNQ